MERMHGLNENRMRRWWTPLAGGPGGLASALALALLIQALLVFRSPLIAPDGTRFIEYAQSLEHRPLAALRESTQHPGYPAVILLLSHATRAALDGQAAWIAAARLAACLGGLASVVLVWRIALRCATPRAATAAALAFAILPVMERHAADALSDLPHLALYLAAVWAACEAYARRSTAWLAACGAASGLAFWFRPEGLSAACVVVAVIVAGRFWRERLRGRLARSVIAVVATSALIAAPYWLLKGTLTAKLTSKAGWQTALGGPATTAPARQAAPQPARADAPVRPVSSPTVQSMPDLRLAWKACAHFAERFAQCVGYLLLVPLLVGAVSIRRAHDPGLAQLRLALAALHVLLLLVLFWIGGYIERRHLLPLLAVAMPAIGVGVLRLSEFARVRFGEAGRRRLLAVAAALAVAVYLPPNLARLHAERMHAFDALHWIREHVPPGANLATNSPHLVCFGRDVAPGIAMARLAVDHDLSQPAFASAQRFVVIEMNGYAFNDLWLQQVAAHYELARVIPRRRERHAGRMLIFERRARRTLAN